MSIQTELLKWASEATEVFNEISRRDPQTQYYQQSPLNRIDTFIDNLIIGINPGSFSPGVSQLTPEQFLAGNPHWENRFERLEEGSKVSSDWKKFFGNTHYFLCQDYNYHSKGIDDDSKTVWTNLTPFATKSKNLLKDIHYTSAVPFTTRLIDILKPKFIYILGSDIRRILEIEYDICHISILQDKQSGREIEIGTINKIPYIQLPHPSRNWGFSHFFIPTIVSIWRQLAERNSLNTTATRIQGEMRQWMARIKALD